jgi:hypothetical protein
MRSGVKVEKGAGLGSTAMRIIVAVYLCRAGFRRALNLSLPLGPFTMPSLYLSIYLFIYLLVLNYCNKFRIIFVYSLLCRSLRLYFLA